MVFSNAKIDGLAKGLQGRHSRSLGSSVSLTTGTLDSRFRGNDENGSVISYEFVKTGPLKKGEEPGFKKALLRIKV